jgi:hypothetical protein
MSFTRWLSNRLVLSARPASRRKTPAARRAFRPTLEALEARWVPSTLTVTSPADSGTGSLRAALAAAHKGDTLVFAPSLDGQAITLSSGELLLTKNLTIAGPGAGELTVSGNNASRVFEVAKGTQVTLSGLTISNGSANGSTNSTVQGGGIYNHGTLTVRACALSDNTAKNNGGGIANDSGATMTISGSTLSHNSVTQGEGGGIANFSTMTVSGSTLSGNSAYNGGGIYLGYDNGMGTATVSNCTLSGNSARHSGGGIENGGTLTVSNSTLSSNSAEFGGGIYNFSSAILTVSGSTLAGNSATFYGGGIYNMNLGTVTISGSILGPATINGITLPGNSAEYGGGIYIGGGTVTVENSSTISGNLAPVGYGADDVDNLGVLYLDSTSTISILDGNHAVPI